MLARGAGRVDAPHHRPDGRSLPARGGQARYRLDALEDSVFENPPDMVRDILRSSATSTRCGGSCCRSATWWAAWRGASSRSSPTSSRYRFRDVFDHLVRLSDEALMLQDRVTSILDAHLSNVSNRLNQQMKLLTLVTTVALPFTVLGGLFGMNVHLPGVSGANDPRAFWSISVSRWRSCWSMLAFPPEEAVALVGRIHRFRRTLPTRSPRRGRRASCVDRQGAGRERHRRGCAARRVTIETAARSLVRVEDDGMGMDAEDARLAIERHATSKIRRAEDLAAIATLGFRGEALPSIASVSHFTLRTRARGEQSGSEIRVHAGTVASMVEAGGAGGHARRRRGGVLQPARAPEVPEVRPGRVRARLAHRHAARARRPAVGFTLISAGRRLLECPPVAGLAERLYQLYGEPDDLMRVDKEAAGVRITGYAAGLAESGPRAGRRTSSSTAAWCATRRLPMPSSTPTAWRRSRNAAPRCTCSSRCRSMRWT